MQPLILLLMLLVGVWIIVMVFALRRKKPTPPPPAATPRACARCGHQNLPEAQFCGECGDPLPHA